MALYSAKTWADIIPVNTHESIVFDTNSSTGIHHTHELAKIAKKTRFYSYLTLGISEFLNLANTRDKNT